MARDDQGGTVSDIYSGRIDTPNRPEAVDEVCHRLAARRLAFDFAGRVSLVFEVASAVYRDPHDPTKPATTLRVEPATPEAMHRAVARVSTWQRYDERKGKLVAKPVPDWVLTQIVAQRGVVDALPVLLGVADHPVFHNGALISGNVGFHEPTNVFIRCREVRAHRWASPIEAAHFLAEDWLGRFPFREPGDLERALLLPLTLLTRRTMIRGGAPLFFITSPEARSGKSLLGRCLVSAVTGAIPATVPFKTNAEEFAKTFDAAALEGQAVIFFNNAANGWAIGTAELDTYVDGDEYSPRLFGSLTKRTVPSLAIPIFCGNNIRPRGDTATRTLEVRLERKGDERDLVVALDYTAKNRPKILSALAELLRYDAAPAEAVSRFPAWEAIVARPLMQALGASTTLQEIAEAVSGAADNPDYEDFVVALAEMVAEREGSSLLVSEGLRWLTAKELIAADRCNEALGQLLMRKGVVPTLRPNNLPAQLAPFKDQAAGGFRLRISPKVGRQPQLFTVEAA